MGIHHRHAWPLLILLVFSFTADAATRVYTTNKATRQSVIQSGSTTAPAGASFQTPNGEAAYYGQEHVDYHSAGNRFQPGDNPGGSQTQPPKKAVKVRPTAFVNKVKAAAKAVAGIRGGIPGIIATVVVTEAIEAIPGGEIIEGVPHRSPSNLQTSTLRWSANPWNAPGGYQVKYYGSYQDACKALSPNITVWEERVYDQSSSTYYYCRVRDKVSQALTTVGYTTRTSLNCSTYVDMTTYTCSPSDPAKVPFGDSDYQMLQTALEQAQNSEWVRDLVRASCDGSLNPAACYDDLSSWGPMNGPAAQSDPPRTQTTTTQYPDGSSSTTTTGTQNNYTYNYGDTFFDVTTTTTTTTNTDGQTTTTTTTDEQPQGETPTDTENAPDEQPEEEPDYQFTDSEFPEIEPFYDQQYPDGLEGVWNDRIAELENSPFLDFLQSFIPTFSGSCPSFGLDFNIGSWLSAGHIEFASLCYVFDFIKIILLVTAVFTARALIFGG